MLKAILGALAAMLLIAAVAAWYALTPSSPPDHRVFINGQVLSMDDSNRVFEAVSVRGELIDQLGTSDEIAALVADGTVVTDLRGGTLLPGFVDAHGHFPGSGLIIVSVDLTSPPVGAITTLGELQAALQARLDGHNDDNWLTGFGYDDTLLAEQRHPTRDDLDAVSATVPIYLTHVSGHMGVANSRALALLGIDADSEAPEGGVIVRRPDSREPEGRLEETAHMPAYERSLTNITPLESVRMVRHASREYASRGVTTAQSGGVDRGMAEGMATLSRFNQVGPRLVMFPFFDKLGAEWLAGDFDPAEIRSGKVIVGPVKIVADGSIQGYTGYLSEPYHVPFEGDADYRGYPAVPREKLFEIVSQFHGAGMQLAIHGNGDASIDDILDAFAAAQQEKPAADPRLIIIHAQMARDDQLQRMQALGATPSFFSAHTYYWGDRHRDIFMGPERAARMSPTRSAADIGLRYSVHLDTPVVPMQPLQLLWSTVNRLSTSGQVIGASQRVSPMEALRAMTIEAAWQIFQDERIGSLEPGKFADLVVLDGDPLTTEDVRELDVLETLVGGVTIYKRP
jgi:predicted amidohydrolase YtcJ